MMAGRHKTRSVYGTRFGQSEAEGRKEEIASLIVGQTVANTNSRLRTNNTPDPAKIEHKL
eukprot:NODE_2334_length_800_cov_320.625832_g1626_i0.p8 GENE.NODE_2334_length_800_cov_320.625832_g1626_i0~~NODE_2334_length_800_cov_320.625832_g1626_i0.p8  ORF type:complete len:70 (+),score=3.06 NODE_2334_length_800_cov_320.625832_g1626_i0:33-212(+)